MSKIFRLICTGDSTSYTTISDSNSGLTWFYVANSYGLGSEFFYNESGRLPTTAGASRQAAIFTNPDGHLCMNMAYSSWKQADLTKQLNGTDGYYSLASLLNQSYVSGGGRPEIINIVAVRVNTNHDTGNPTTDAAATRTYCLALQALGVKVIILPIWSKTSVAWDNSYTIPYNAIINGWGTSDGVAAVVPSTNPLIYAAGACDNPVYFRAADKIHPLQPGQDIGASDYLTVQNALIASLS